MKKFYQLITAIFFIILAGSAGAAELSLKSVYPAMGKFGKDLQVTLTGTGFDANTRVSMYPDTGSKRSIISSVLTPGSAEAVAVVGDIAFVAWDSLYGGSVLYLIDIKIFSQPRLIGSVDTSGNADATGVTVVGNTAFLACGYRWRGLQVIDISTPSQPEIIGLVETPNAANGVAVSGNIAFMACGNHFMGDGKASLQVIDISTPSQPKIIGSVETPNWATGVAVVGTTAYVSDSDSLQVIDVSTPSLPVIIGSVDTWDARGVAVSGNTAFIAGGGSGLQVIDISTPSKPQIIGSADTPHVANGVAVEGNTAYVADWYSGLQVIDVSTPSQPEIIGSFYTAGCSANGVAVVGNTAFLAGCGLMLIDIGYLSQPEIIGFADTPDSALDVAVAGTIAYVADGDSGLQVIDVSTSSHPVIIGSADTPGHAYGVTVAGNIAYVADWGSGLQVIDVSTPSQPQTIGTVESAYRIGAVVGDIAFGLGGDLQVIDISTPSQPNIINSAEILGSANELAIVGDTAFLACGSRQWDGLQVFDISTPSQPKSIGSLETLNSATGVAAVGDTAYVADASGALLAIDLSEPSQPNLIGSVDIPDSPNDVTLSGDTLYLAGSTGLITVPLKAVTEIKPVTVNSETQITATLPSPPAPGHWTLRVFKGDEYDELPGAVTFSEPETYGQQTQKKAVIVAGGGPYRGNTLWEATQMCANYAYRALLYQGYTRENIYYLSPDTAADIDGDGFFNDTDADATVANLSHALNVWAKDPESPAYELLIYMTDHGGPGTFRINEYEILQAEDLGRWLDDLQETMPGKILFVYDACEAGSFLSALVPRPGKERILITSAEAGKPAHFLYKGSVSFSFQFWAHIYMGSDVADAFFFAEEMVKKRQTPWIDADGDGIPNKKADRDLVINFVIGRGYVPASDMPSIRDISGEQTLNGEPGAKIWAGPATDSNGISRVWGIIVPPGYAPESADTPVTDLPSFELFDTDQDGIYEAEYTGFNTQGFYKITVYAEDLQGMYSLPLHTAVIQTDGKAVLKGDLSGNWKIDAGDLIIALKVLSGTDDSGLAWSDYANSGADINGDGKIGFEELFYILKTLATDYKVFEN